MLIVKKIDHSTSVDNLFSEMIYHFQKQYDGDFEKIFADKRKKINYGSLKAMGLFNKGELIGYLEYEEIQKDKIAIYIVYTMKAYKRGNMMSFLIRESVRLLELEGFKNFVAHVTELRYVPIKKSLIWSGFRNYLRYEMRLSLKSKKSNLKHMVTPFSPDFSSMLKEVMTKAFKDSVDYRLYSEFFTSPGQDKMLEKIIQGGYGPLIKDCSPILFYEGKIIGYGLVTEKDSETSFLMDFAIDPDYQKNGLGRELLFFIINLLTERGYKYLNLAVTYDNYRAFNLYKKAGFKTIGIFSVLMYNSNNY